MRGWGVGRFISLAAATSAAVAPLGATPPELPPGFEAAGPASVQRVTTREWQEAGFLPFDDPSLPPSVVYLERRLDGLAYRPGDPCASCENGYEEVWAYGYGHLVS